LLSQSILNKNFDERPHHRGEFFMVNNVMRCLEHCSRPPAVPLFPLLIFCCINCRSTDYQCLSVGRTVPKIAPFRGGSRPLIIHGSLIAPESTLQLASGSVRPFLQGSRTWPTNRHTDHASSVCSNRSHLCTECISCGVMNKLITLKFVAKTPNSPHFRCKSTIRCGWNIGVRRKENASDRVHRRYESSSPETNRRLRCCERLPVAACSESTCLYQDYSSRRSTQ